MGDSLEPQKPVCGIVMPISAIDGCTESHWTDVHEIICESIEDAGFVGNLVSNADDVGIIQKRIIQNLYDNPIVVCDVSGKNPNVMFELGLRLAFDKPTIIIKDDRTSYSFDTSAIEHLEYPRDLRFSQIIEFKRKLSDKIRATSHKAATDTGYTTFLKHFGEFKVAKLDKKEVSGQEYVLEEIRALRTLIRRLELRQSPSDSESARLRRARMFGDVDICLVDQSEAEIAKLLERASGHPDIREVLIEERGQDHRHLIAKVKPGADLLAIEKFLGAKPRLREGLRREVRG